MKTKLFSLFLMLTISAGTIFASDTRVGGIWYNFDASLLTAEVTYRGSSHSAYSDEYTGAVTIPTSVTYNNVTYSVTSIGAHAFEYCSSLNSVSIPNSVTNIGSAAFFQCSDLSSVTIGNNVVRIGDEAFAWCTGLSSVTIPNSVTNIESGAFAWCTGLSSVTIPNSVTSIGQSAFCYCNSLSSLTIGNSVTSIGKSAFLGCSSLTSVTIPNSVTSIGSNAFESCTNLTSVHITDVAAWCGISFNDNPLWYAHNLYLNGKLVTKLVIPNNVTSIDERAFSGCTGLTSVTIPNSVTSIGNEAFYNCSKLDTVNISSSAVVSKEYEYNNSLKNIFGEQVKNYILGGDVLNIGNNAFYGCSGLTSVMIGNGVTSIGTSAFSHCKSLTSVTIPNSVTSIGAQAFNYCSVLPSVTIPNSVSSIGISAFESCTRLSSVHINDIAAWCKIDFAYYTANPLYFAHNLYLNGELVTNLVIPNSFKTISRYAFSGCTSLTSVTIPNSVTDIGEWAFYNCSGLPSVTVPNSVTSIGGSAFSGCTGLTSVTIPNSVISIGEGAFSGCTGLTSVTIPNSVTSIGRFAFSGCTGLTSVTIPNSVTSIGNNAFYNCTGLTSVTIPNSVTSIGDRTFQNCTSLTSIVLEPETPPDCGTGVFGGCSKLKSIIVPCGSLERYRSKSVWSDYASIINYVYLASITSMTENGSVSTDKDVVTVCDDPFVTLTAIPDYGYHFIQWNDGITDNPRTIELYQDTTFIAEFAVDKSGTCGANNELIWSYEDESKTLTISGSGELTENYTFGIEVPTQMQSLIIGNEVTAIGDSVFYATNTLNHLTIGGNVASIGDYAFAECKNFDDITCYATTVPTISDKTFEDIGNKQYIYLYVPEDRERAYKRDTYWGQFDIQVIGGTKTTIDDLVVESTDNTADIIWPTIPGAETYELVIKDKDGNVVCTLIFNSEGQLVSIIFGAPARGTTSEQAQTEGFSFTVTGLVEGETYDLTITAKDADGNVLDVKSMTFVAGAGTQQGISQTITLTDTSTKIFRDGQILIIRGNKTYTVTGQEVR